MEKETLRIALVQCNLNWESPEKNLEHFETLFASLKDVDLILLPEMFTTGFSMNCTKADGNGSTLRWMKKMCQTYRVAIAGSVMTEVEGRFYNRFQFVEPDGFDYCYDKRHLFRMAEEEKYYSPGNERLIINYLGWRICPLICYDLRFPGWSRNQHLQSDEKEIVYDLLLYVANWPQKRETAWKSLLPARAIENYAYCIGVNRVGLDGNMVPYSGHSMAIDPSGTILAEAEAGKESLIVAELSLNALKKFRHQFPSWKDADNLMLK